MMPFVIKGSRAFSTLPFSQLPPLGLITLVWGMAVLTKGVKDSPITARLPASSPKALAPLAPSLTAPFKAWPAIGVGMKLPANSPYSALCLRDLSSVGTTSGSILEMSSEP